MAVLCFCISIGCQLFFEDTEEMAFGWYETGLSYLDKLNWGTHPNGMQALALIDLFHMNRGGRQHNAIAIRRGGRIGFGNAAVTRNSTSC